MDGRVPLTPSCIFCVFFVQHHLLSGAVAYFVVHPFFHLGQLYAVFFMGLTEISTIVLSLLSNFGEFLVV